MSTPTLVSDSSDNARLRLFLISFLILFLELACIRWFGSAVIFLTFFTNIILMACFLGMSVGLLSANGRHDFSRLSVPLLFVSSVLAWGTLSLFRSFSHLSVDVGGQTSPQQIFFGTEYTANDPARISVPIELIAGLFFVLIALTFVGLGQIMGRAFNAIPDRIAAYTADIAGSVCGILLFGVCSYFRTPPALWFTIALALFFWLRRSETKIETRSETRDVESNKPNQGARTWNLVQAVAAVGVVIYAAIPGKSTPPQIETYWSPYYKIDYEPPPRRSIITNNIGHQSMHTIPETGAAYALPHLLNRDAGRKRFDDVLIIGAGSGNDVQATRLFGGKNVKIDAVEIDPVIQSLGIRDHPDKPYDDPRVTRHNDDGRSFVKKANKKYDLVIYALVDSLVLHSGYSSLRLESFLFTRQAFEDIKAKLKPNGVFAMYNFYRQGWVVARLAKLGEEVFGRKPVVISLPYRKTIKPEEAQFGSYTFILCGDTKSIEQKFAATSNFWVNEHPSFSIGRNGFSPQPPPPQRVEKIEKGVRKIMDAPWQKIAPAQIDVSMTTLLPSDDWPFLYLRERTIPSLNVRGMILIAVLSLLLLWLIGLRGANTLDAGNYSARTLGWKTFNWQMFFLGAGFMLLETKSVVHMALLFGSTWIVNSFVFGAILVMILLSNLWVAKAKPKNVLPYYILLLVSLLIGLLVPMNTFLALPGIGKILASCAVTFIPIFFAGVAFSSAFRESRRPDVDFGCNIAGIILGGLCEYFSLALGFNGLLGLAMIFYALSFFLRPHARESASLDGAVLDGAS